MSPENNFILAPKVKGYKIIDSSSGLSIFRYFSFCRSAFLRAVILFFYTFWIVRKKRIDIIVCGVPVSIGLIGLVFKKIARLPYCVFYYGGELEKYKRRKIILRLLERVLKNACFVIVNSEFTSKEVKKFGIEEDKVIKVTPGVDVQIFKPDLDCSDLKKRLGLENKKVLLTVSRLVERKGIDVVIKALARLSEKFPSLVYLIVGSGEQEGYLKALVEKNSLNKNVIFIGKVTNEDLPKYYNLCDIYVMPNRKTLGEEIIEGFGISFIEASACAKPVIGGNSGGAGEAVWDKRTGFLIDSEDIDALVQSITCLLEDEKQAGELGNTGRRLMQEEFRWQYRADSLKKILSCCLQK
ncbi:MAG: glycosyltransferase family 4 protein [Candidatus Omnitrophica bacterium]|nr:glycosyltransferase family 4 protein [Candidatus Omnitrophota bacterium]